MPAARKSERKPARSGAKATTGRRKQPRQAARSGAKPALPSNLSAPDKRYLQQHGNKLSPSTLRARWIGSPDEHAERDGQTLATRNHDVIRQWAEARGAVPSTVPGTEHGNLLGVMRLNFPGFGGRNLQEVSWEQWFNTFDKRKLTFLFQENKRDGNQSNFFKLDSPLREDG